MARSVRPLVAIQPGLPHAGPQRRVTDRGRKSSASESRMNRRMQRDAETGKSELRLRKWCGYNDALRVTPSPGP